MAHRLLGALRLRLKVVSTGDDPQLEAAITAGESWVDDRVCPPITVEGSDTWANINNIIDPATGERWRLTVASGAPAFGARPAEIDDVVEYDGAQWVNIGQFYDFEAADVTEAKLLLAARLYSRQRSPEGVSGFGAEGFVVRITANDPDLRALLERHYDYSRAGIG